MNHVIKGALVASAVAGMLGCGSSSQTGSTTPSGTSAAAGIHCQGINECRGRGECTGNGHPCGRHTPCRGQGWITVQSAEECQTRGGTVL